MNFYCVPYVADDRRMCQRYNEVRRTNIRSPCHHGVIYYGISLLDKKDSALVTWSVPVHAKCRSIAPSNNGEMANLRYISKCSNARRLYRVAQGFLLTPLSFLMSRNRIWKEVTHCGLFRGADVKASFFLHRAMTNSALKLPDEPWRRRITLGDRWAVRAHPCFVVVCSICSRELIWNDD